MKVLFICDDIWHPADVLKEGMGYMEPEEFQFDFVITAKDILTPELLREYPVIINAKGNAVNAANTTPWFEPGVTEVMPADLRRYVEEGGGFLSLHSGNSFRMDGGREYCEFVGNSFAGHPPRCPVTIEPVAKHPITEGVCSFTVRDEHYQLADLAQDIEVFLESVSESGGRQPAGYTRQIGKGRLCVLTPGHTLSVLKNENFRRLLSNAVRWCAGN